MGGLGSKMLERSKFMREKLEADIRMILHDASGTKDKVRAGID